MIFYYLKDEICFMIEQYAFFTLYYARLHTNCFSGGPEWRNHIFLDASVCKGSVLTFRKWNRTLLVRHNLFVWQFVGQINHLSLLMYTLAQTWQYVWRYTMYIVQCTSSWPTNDYTFAELLYNCTCSQKSNNFRECTIVFK